MKDIVIYGAGGLGREVRWLLNRINREVGPTWNFRGYVVTEIDSDTAKEELAGDEPWLIGNPELSVALAIGTPRARLAVARRLEQHFGVDAFPCLIDPTVIYDEESCELRHGAIITAGCILTVNVTIDTFAYINLNCTIGHETTIGSACVLNPTVKISGGVKIEEGVLIGTGATVLQYLHIGKHATLGSGAVATRNLDANTVYVGIPAKPKDELVR